MSSNECSICYDAIDATTGVATLSCAHSFHICCIAGWFAKLEKGTCPCCRKEMSAIEDLPPATETADDSDDSDDEDDDDDSVDEVEFCRAHLDAFLRARGGHGLTDAMAAEVCPEFGTFMGTELNALVVGNGGRPLTREEWIALLEEEDNDDDEEEDEDNDEIAAAVATVWNELASYDEPPRAWLMADGSWTSTVLNPEEATAVTVIASPAAAPAVAASAATKVQAVWRGFKGRLAMRA